MPTLSVLRPLASLRVFRTFLTTEALIPPVRIHSSFLPAINWAPYFKYIIESVVNGTAIDTDWCGDIATNSVVISGVNEDVAAKGTIDKMNSVADELKAGTLHVFDTSKFTVDGKNLDSYLADVDGDFHRRDQCYPRWLF